jgi:hypothetical protein
VQASRFGRESIALSRIGCAEDESRRMRCAPSLRVARNSLARSVLSARTMRSDETWTIPLHVIMWTTIAVGLIMAMVVVMMH